MEPINPEALDVRQLPLMDIDDIARKYIDVPYCDRHEDQKLDIYLPEKGSDPYPVILNIHGGGFVVGSRREVMMRPLLEGALERGYAYICADYRLGDAGRFPNVVYDVKAAVRFIRANAATYRLDPRRIGAIGSSAGGYLSMMLAATAAYPMYEDLAMGNAGQSSAVSCAVSEFGMFDAELNYELVTKNNLPDSEATTEDICTLLGADIGRNPTLGRLASVFNAIGKDLPPVLLQHGDSDAATAYQQSVMLKERIDEVCGMGRAEVDILPGNGHIGKDFYTAENVKRIMDFFEKHM